MVVLYCYLLDKAIPQHVTKGLGMGHFRGTIQGTRGQASRLGTQSSGLSSHMNGWSLGTYVELHYDKELDMDLVTIFITSGSNSHYSSKPLGTFFIEDGEYKQMESGMRSRMLERKDVK